MKAEILKGLLLMVELSLPFAPGGDLKNLAAVWAQVFKNSIGQVDATLDIPRIQHAFTASFHRLKEWPAPAIILEHLPARPQVVGIEQHTSGMTFQEKVYAQRCLEALKDKLAGIITQQQLKDAVALPFPLRRPLDVWGERALLHVRAKGTHDHPATVLA